MSPESVCFKCKEQFYADSDANLIQLEVQHHASSLEESDLTDIMGKKASFHKCRTFDIIFEDHIFGSRNYAHGKLSEEHKWGSKKE